MLKQRLRRIEARMQQSAAVTIKPRPWRLRTAEDVIELLYEQIEAIRAAAFAGTLEKARAIGYLAGIARKAIEASNMAARMETLETILTLRKKEAKR
jgi:hypothetical protein